MTSDGRNAGGSILAHRIESPAGRTGAEPARVRAALIRGRGSATAPVRVIVNEIAVRLACGTGH